MHRQRIAVIAAGIVGIVAVFLPWRMTGLGPASGLWVDLEAAILLVALFALAAGAAVFGPRRDTLSRGAKALTVALGALTVAFGVWQIISLHRDNAEVAEFGAELARRGAAVDNPVDPTVTTVAFGLYLVIAAGVALVVAARASRVRPRAT